MIESYLIKMLLYYTNYNKYRAYIDISSLEPETKKIIGILDKIYEDSPDQDISRDKILLRLQSEYPSMKDEELDTYNSMVDIALGLEVNVEEDKDILKSLFKKTYINKLYQYLMLGLAEPARVEFDAIAELIDEYHELIEANKDEDTVLTLEEIMEWEGDTSGYKWPTPELQEALGNIKGGDLGKIVATPEAGKSALVHTIASSVAKQGGKVVLWNNEERYTKVLKRSYECVCGVNAREFKGDYAKYNRIYQDYIDDRLVIKDDTAITIPKIKKSILTYAPDLVIIDQSAKIRAKDKGRTDLTLAGIDEELRNLCKKYNVHIIGVSQADATAFNKDYISMNCINGSNIAVQGELDYILGINWKNDLNSDPDLRYISTPKNKIGQRPESKFILYLDRDTNTYKSLEEVE